MPPSQLTELLKLPPGERADIAFALWDSLNDEARAAELALSSEDRAELDRRAAEHDADPGTSIAWDAVRRKLREGL